MAVVTVMTIVALGLLVLAGLLMRIYIKRRNYTTIHFQGSDANLVSQIPLN